MRSEVLPELLELVVRYFLSLGIERGSLESIFNSETFDRGIIIRLPAVCVMNGNRPGSIKTHQSHIHLTGRPRYFFYNQEVVDGATQSSTDRNVPMDISIINLEDLSGNMSHKSRLELGTRSTHTMVKIGCRKRQETQVQISKTRQDGNLFLELRRNLYENDALIFLGYRESDRTYTIGIHKDADILSAFGETEFFDGSSGLAREILNPFIAIADSYGADVTRGFLEVLQDKIFQWDVSMASPSSTVFEPIEKTEPNAVDDVITRRIASRAKEAIIENHYKCALDDSHITFMTRLGNPYIEAHHLIPMSKEVEFDYSLDVKGNIVPLCPFCHSRIHYGTFTDISIMIERLYEIRADLLSRSGIHVELNILKEFYR